MSTGEPCAGAVVRDDRGRVLLVRRGHEPDAGRWAIPAGRAEPGESLPQTAAREVLEETGYVVEIGDAIWRVDLHGPGHHFDVTDFIATVVGGGLRAGDDAAEVRWVDGDLYPTLDVVESVDRMLRACDLLPD